MTNSLAEIKKNTVDIVSRRIVELEQKGEIDFPVNYSPQNALKSAWLILQGVETRDKRPVLEACSRTSIMNSLLDMTIQGLNPVKKQCYFIAYGNKLICQRSYHGSKAVAKMVDPRIDDITAQVIWQGDEFEYEIVRGKKRVVSHKQKLQNIDSKTPVGAYCEVIDLNGEVMSTTIATYNQIKTAWKKSQMRPVSDDGTIKAGSTHSEFLEEMIKKTVINLACKSIINSSSDSTLKEAVDRSEQVQSEELQREEEARCANQGEIIDIDPVEEIEEAEPEQVRVVREWPEEPQEQPEKETKFEPGF
jgi:recombination protein RecT